MTNIIVMAFSPRNIIGCFLKKRLTKGGGGHGHPRTPSLRPCDDAQNVMIFILINVSRFMQPLLVIFF